MKYQKCANQNCRIAKSTLKGNLAKVLKRKKVSKKDVKTEQSPTKMRCQKPKKDSIFALNHDCLIEVFRYLNMNDLANLVNASPKFELSAYKVYRLKYRQEVLSIYIKTDANFVMRLDDAGLFGTFTLPQMKQFFENFGTSIYKVRIEDGLSQSTVVISLLKLIIKYCKKSLYDLRLSKIQITSKILLCLRPIQPKIQRLELHACILEKQFSNIFTGLTNLMVLRLSYVAISPESIHHVFPNLVHFSIYCSRTVENQHLTEFIELNPQLSVFDIRYCRHISHHIFEPIGKHLPNLSELHIRFCQKYSGSFKQFPLNVKNLRQLSLVGFRNLETYLSGMVENNQQLSTLELHDQNLDESVVNVINCIGMYSNIRTLELNQASLTRQHLTLIARNAKNVREMKLSTNSNQMHFGFDALVSLADSCKQLTVLELNTRRAKTLQFTCESLHGFVDVLESRPNESSRKLRIKSRDSIHVKVPQNHLVMYQHLLKLETQNSKKSLNRSSCTS